MAVYEVDTTAPNYAEELASLGITGTIHYAPYGTELPKNMGKLEAPFVDLGWISDDGMGETMNEERDDWTPWQATSPIRGQVSKQEFEFQATLWSLGGLANALYYGVPEEDMDYDEESDVASFEQGGELPPDYRFVIVVTVVDGEKVRRRLVPAASVSERGDIQESKTELVGYELTFAANYDSAEGYSVRREFTGWKPGTAGTTVSADKVASLGDWSTPVNEDNEGGDESGES